MYILDQRAMPMFTAPDGAPWPRGTAIALEPFPQHSGSSTTRLAASKS